MEFLPRLLVDEFEGQEQGVSLMSNTAILAGILPAPPAR